VAVVRESHKLILSLTGEFAWKVWAVHKWKRENFNSNFPVRLKKILWEARSTPTLVPDQTNCSETDVYLIWKLDIQLGLQLTFTQFIWSNYDSMSICTSQYVNLLIYVHFDVHLSTCSLFFLSLLQSWDHVL
jgi:hypothetical protein